MSCIMILYCSRSQWKSTKDEQHVQICMYMWGFWLLHFEWAGDVLLIICCSGGSFVRTGWLFHSKRRTNKGNEGFVCGKMFSLHSWMALVKSLAENSGALQLVVARVRCHHRPGSSGTKTIWSLCFECARQKVSPSTFQVLFEWAFPNVFCGLSPKNFWTGVPGCCERSNIGWQWKFI